MKTIVFIISFLLPFTSMAQRFYLGESLSTNNGNFQLIAIQEDTDIYSYKYSGSIYDRMFEREISDIVVGVKDDVIVLTIYYLEPQLDDIGVPSSILSLIENKTGYAFGYSDGYYGMTVDNTSIAFIRDNSAFTFGNDRIAFLSTVKNELLQKDKSVNEENHNDITLESFYRDHYNSSQDDDYLYEKMLESEKKMYEMNKEWAEWVNSQNDKNQANNVVHDNTQEIIDAAKDQYENNPLRSERRPIKDYQSDKHEYVLPGHNIENETDTNPQKNFLAILLGGIMVVLFISSIIISFFGRDKENTNN